ncbi:MAG: Purine nucleoside phosphorylase [Campylobacterota bacterium]|nr:Purine nucleoside phosphorylase [Campylobacterota bacterium]
MVEFYRFKGLQKYKQCIHAVTAKNTNIAYEGSLALHTGEECSSIIQNRKRVAFLLEIDARYNFVAANQTHSSHIEVITERQNRGWESRDDAVLDCDALITNTKGAVLTILTADCVPILLYDPKLEIVAAIHAGWKGTQANISSKTIGKMKEIFGSNPKDVIAGIAPSIGRCCYEVGEDVAQYFTAQPEVLDRIGDKYKLDLPLANKIQLLSAGLLKENIEMSDICTACEVKRFFSYRKERGCSGRFMSMIGLKQNV